jgi:hypothetical protein
MTYILSQSQPRHCPNISAQKRSFIYRFFQWAADKDDKHRIGWAGGSVTAMTAIFFPLTMAVALINGATFGLITVAMCALVLVVVTNLATMSTRYTIPFFFLCILVDAVTIIASFSFIDLSSQKKSTALIKLSCAFFLTAS